MPTKPAACAAHNLDNSILKLSIGSSGCRGCEVQTPFLTVHQLRPCSIFFSSCSRVPTACNDSSTPASDRAQCHSIDQME
jgi:hypothetical protein